MKKKIIVVGYPRSGNVWLARVLGDVFDCEITADKRRKTIAKKEYGKNEDYLILQDHYIIVDKEKGKNSNVFIDEHYINLENRQEDCYIIFMYRHPFDVCTSVYRYWKRDSIHDVLDLMKNDVIVPNYSEFMKSWSYHYDHINLMVSYEKMKKDIYGVIKRVTFTNNYQVPETYIINAIEKTV